MIAKRVLLHSEEYKQLLRQGWKPGRVTKHVNITWPPMKEVIMVREER